ncbi:MAG: exodeoxyribonuclease VII small subunit [Sulfurospirillum sp.]|nr:exodeoxyribonuclease VII small subunit [Sulfurospirillum sp.]
MENSTFEEKLEKAKSLLQELSDPDIPLARGMEKYTQGMQLLQEATKMIEEAKLQYASLQTNEDNAHV